MTPAIRTVHWGTGAMGSHALRIAARTPGLAVAGVVSQRSAAHAAATLAREAPGAAGAVAGDDLAGVVARCGGADVVLLATHGHLVDLEAQLTAAFELGLRVVCIGEDAIYPAAVDAELARRLERLAQRRGVAMVGTGANPGYVMDWLPMVLTAATAGWTSIRVRRASSLAPFGETVLRSMGVGLSPEQFGAAAARGEIDGHVGYGASVAFLAAGLGVPLEIVDDVCEPIVRERPTELDGHSHPGGVVVGVDQRCRAVAPTGQTVTLEHPQRLGRLEGEEPLHDLIEIDGGELLRARISPALDGGIATVALMINLIPALVNAEPGIHTIASLPLTPFHAPAAQGRVAAANV
ncbi:hypothetical protein [Conexibacter arvalis]|uniref:4-hydroxy-tetrahydrodipicolinate reductase n=1 Tax=Conexibacter arvalis TaxID=912552 RepID=A0A840IAW8_9ACTN|nr:hypothetical protein [Conexibacter arvalis]MBB4661393.1 4-hydroxy-tetrahydrodipicolinate reductase [Conexibacter arvalis]